MTPGAVAALLLERAPIISGAILHHCHVDGARSALSQPVANRAKPGGRLAGPLDDQERPVAFADAFMRLMGEHREIMLLVVVEGLDAGETAGILKILIGSLRSRLASSRQAMPGVCGVDSTLPMAQRAG
jgi:DNA-directed RNA polymerase specialized sigma24 family protein